jgi:hypothetical protein
VEAETSGLRAWLRDRPDEPLVSSLLARVESARALHRTDPAALVNLPAVFASVNLIMMSESICLTAAAYPEPGLRSLDAIHMATTAVIGSPLSALVTYDQRLAAVARGRGLPVVSPT